MMTREIDGNVNQLWGDPLNRFEAMSWAVPKRPELRCEYWTARARETKRPRPHTFWGFVREPLALRRFVDDEREKACEESSAGPSTRLAPMPFT